MSLNFGQVALGRYTTLTLAKGSSSYVFTKLARVGLTVAALVLGATAFALAETTATPVLHTVAQESPTPAPSPKAFTYHGFIRAFDFTRQNAYSSYGVPSGVGGKANQSSENNAISLSGNYAFLGSGFSVGASYLYANPFNQCSNPATASSALPGPCGTKSVPPGLNPDTTLPQFELSTLYEAYVKYNGNGLNFQGGQMAYGTPWTPISDSRLKPVSYQGADLSYKINPNWTVEAMDFWQWQCRTCSAFDQGTLLTAVAPGGYTYSGATAYANTYLAPGCTPGVTCTTEMTPKTAGTFYGRVGYVGNEDLPLTANLYYYDFESIASAWWLDAKYNFGVSKLKPFAALQAGSENAPYSDLLGKIQSSIFGLQVGFYPMTNVMLSAAFDSIPIRTDTVTLPTGITCNVHTHQIVSAHPYGINFPYFLPTGGTAQCTAVSPGVADVYYGGWASPYTDSYVTDPTFITSGTTGIIDRRSPGNGVKLQATFTSDDRQFWVQVGQTWYDFSNPGYSTTTNATDFDTQYFFMKVPKTGPYKGLSFRVRLFSRSATNFPPPGNDIAGLFKYDRFQLEYDF
jgi:hypothetical protein